MSVVWDIWLMVFGFGIVMLGLVVVFFYYGGVVVVF